MRVPPFERYGKLLQGAGLVMAGMVIGAAIFSSLYHSQFNALVELKSELEQQLDDYQGEIRQLNRFKSQHTIIKSAIVRIEEDPASEGPSLLDEPTKAALKKQLKKELEVFVGRSIYDIDKDAKLARLLLDRKVYSDIEGKSYTVEIKTALVADNVLQVWIRAKPYSRPSGTANPLEGGTRN